MRGLVWTRGPLEVLKKNLFSVYLAADDQDESEISFGEWGSPSKNAEGKMCFK